MANMPSKESEEGVVDHASGMVDEARAFTSSISESVNSFSESLDLRGRVQRSPIAMVSAALGIGYVVGGGLFSPVTRRLLKAGVGMMLVPFVRRQLAAMSSSTSSRSAGEQPAAPRTP